VSTVEKVKDENSCAICGLALHTHEIGAAIVDGDLIEFSIRSWGSVDLVVCSDCWKKVSRNIDQTYDKALERRREIDPAFTPEKKMNQD